MEKNAHYFLVGVFVSAALVLALGFIIWMHGAHDTRHYQYYTVYFTDSVSGLEDGANVQYHGINVGKVVNMRLTPGDNELVKVDIAVVDGTPIQAQTKASLEMQGITGLVHMQLETANADKTPPQHRPGEPYPVLQGSGLQWTQLMDDLPGITHQLREVSGKINKMLSGKGGGGGSLLKCLF